MIRCFGRLMAQKSAWGKFSASLGNSRGSTTAACMVTAYISPYRRWCASCAFGALASLTAATAVCESSQDSSHVVREMEGGMHGQTTKKWYFWKGRPSGEDASMDNMVIFGGSVYPEISRDICNLLGISPGRINLGRYADGECSVLIKDPILGKDVFIVTPTHTNDSLVELLLIVSAAKRSSAGSVIAVVPFYGYSRQDRRFRREPIAAADIAHMLEAMGVDRVITVDLHSGQIQGFFSPTTPVDHLSPMGVAAAYFAEMVTGELGLVHPEELSSKADSEGGLESSFGGSLEGQGKKEGESEGKLDEEGEAVDLSKVAKIVVVAPQEGQVGRANQFKERIHARLQDLQGHGQQSPGGKVNIPVSLAFIARSSTKNADEDEEVHKHCIGDVKGALCIIVDDLVDTGGTLENAVNLLTAAGASKIIAFATHGRFSGDGEKKVMEAKGLERLVICNTLPHRTSQGELKERKPSGKIQELNISPLLAEAVFRVHKRIPFAELLHGSHITSQVDKDGQISEVVPPASDS